MQTRTYSIKSCCSWHTLTIVGICAIALAIRVHDLDAASLWEDDYSNIDRALLHLRTLVLVQNHQGPANTIFDIHPPLFYALLKLALAFDCSTLAARSISVLGGILGILGLSLLGTRLFSRASGLAASALITFSVMHVLFSRVLKPYGWFICFFTFAAWLLLRALSDDKVRDWTGYVLCCIGLCYTAYQGIVTVAAFSAYGWLVAGPLPWRTGVASNRKRFFRFLASTGLIVVGILPMIAAARFVTAFLLMPDLDPFKNLNFLFLHDIISKFITYDFGTPEALLAGWLGMVGLGAVFAVRSGQKHALLLLALVAGANCAALFVNKTRLRELLEVRHFVCVYLVWLLLAGNAVAGLAKRLAGRMPHSGRRTLAAGTLGALFCLGLSASSIASLPRAYGLTFNRDRDLYAWLEAIKENVQALDFTGYKRNMRRYAAWWYLPGLYQEAGSWDAPAYRRMYLMETDYTDKAMRPEPDGVETAHWRVEPVRTAMRKFGFANRSPLPMVVDASGRSRYQADFRTYAFYRDAHASANMTLDRELGLLRPSRYAEPGSVVYAFELPDAARPADIQLALNAALYKRHPSEPADSLLRVEASADGERFTPLGQLGQDDIRETVSMPFFDEIPFYDGLARTGEKRFAVPPEFAAKGRLYLRIRYEPGHVEGYLNLAGLTLDVRVEPDAATASATATFRGRSAERREAANVARNAGVIPWEPGMTAAGQTLFAFAAPGYEDLGDGRQANPIADVPAFVRENPQAMPVHTVLSPRGDAVVTFYDTGLAQPGIAFDAAHSRAHLGRTHDAPFALGNITLSGRLEAPSFSLDGQTYAIPVFAPDGTTLTLNPGGTGRLVFSPPPEDPAGTGQGLVYSEGLAIKRPSGDEATLACEKGRSCVLSYTFSSALPFTELRVTAFPTVYGNPCDKCPGNQARLSYSIDGGKTYNPLLGLDKTPDCEWTSKFEAQYRRIRLPRRTTSLTLLFAMQYGEEAAFSLMRNPLYRMRLEADLDATALPAPRLDHAPERIVLNNPEGQRFTAFFNPAPLPISRRTIRPW